MISGRCLSVYLVLSVRLSVTLVYCGQTETTGWIKMPLGKEIGLDPGHIVLDGDPPPTLRCPQNGGTPNFWPMPVVEKRLDGSRCQLVVR